jgi:hypothetical protein
MEITEKDQERFWSKVEKGPVCWEWQACRSKGYGLMLLNGRAQLAHRISAVIAGKKLDKGLEVMHTCDNPSCVNPAHLEVGSHKDNMQDAYRKKRMKGFEFERPDVYADNDPNARTSRRRKLTDDDVRTIRILYLCHSEEWPYRRLGQYFGVDHTAIALIVTGKKRRGAGPLNRG